MNKNIIQKDGKNVLSVITLYDNNDVAAFEELHKSLDAHFSYYELVVMGSPGAEYAAFEEKVKHLSRIRFLQSNINAAPHSLRQIAFHEAIGDIVIMYDPEECDPQLLPRIVAKHSEGYDFVGTRYAREDSLIYNTFDKLFTYLLCLITGYALIPNLTSTGGYTRALVTAINNREKNYISARILLAELTTNYTLLEQRLTRKKQGITDIATRLALALEVAGSVPTRMLTCIIWLSLLLCFGNMLYMLYVVAVFLFFADIQPGWTTTSLFLSVFSIAFFFITFVFSSIYLGKIKQKNSKQLFVASEHNYTDMFTAISQINVTDNFKE